MTSIEGTTYQRQRLTAERVSTGPDHRLAHPLCKALSYPRLGGSSTTMNARTTKLPSHILRGSSTMHHMREYVIVESAPLPDLPMQRMAHTGALNIPLSDSATSCDAAERGSLSPPELPTRAKRALENNNNLFAPWCHFWIEVFHRFLLSVFQVFYSAEPTYPITAKYLRILSPEKSRRGRPKPSLYRLHMG